MILNPWVVAFCFAAAAAILGRVAYRHYRELRRLRERFAPVVDADAQVAAAGQAVAAARQAVAEAVRERQKIEAENDRRRVQMMQDYARSKSTYDALKGELFRLEENVIVKPGKWVKSSPDADSAKRIAGGYN